MDRLCIMTLSTTLTILIPPEETFLDHQAVDLPRVEDHSRRVDLLEDHPDLRGNLLLEDQGKRRQHHLQLLLLPPL